MTSDLPIGVFDSGVGGLTVLKAVRDRLPHEDLIYLGDTARLPYGTKSAQAVSHYALQAAHALVGLGIKALVVADNTSSAHALPTLRASFPDLPVIGVVEPGAAAAAIASRRGRIVVISTESTAQADQYPKAILHSRPDAAIASRPCPLFVPLVEEGMVDGPIVEKVVHHYLDDLFRGPQAGDCLLLGCTHFPPLAPLLRRVLGGGVAIVDSATTTARAVEELLDNRALATGRSGQGATRYLATDSPARFARVAGVFVPWGIAASDIEMVELG
jgi:glutamate racemase